MRLSVLKAHAALAAVLGTVLALGAVGAMQAFFCVGHARADGFALLDGDTADQGGAGKQRDDEREFHHLLSYSTPTLQP
jgi:hypothetical protein